MISIIAQNIMALRIRPATKIVAGCLLYICSSGMSEAGELQQIIKERSALQTAATSTATVQNTKGFSSSKEAKQRKSTAKKVSAPAFTKSSLADKLNQKLTGQSSATKKTAKSVDASIPDSLDHLEKMKLKIKNPAGFHYIVSPAGTPSMIKANDLSDSTPPVNTKSVGKTAATGRDSSAREFLRSNHKALRLADPDSELELYKTTTDELGITRHRYQQRFNGIAVWGKELSVYVNKAGALHLFYGNYRPTSAIRDTTPTIPASEAIQRVLTDLDVKPANVTGQVATLVIWHDENTRSDHLVWHVELAAGTKVYWHYFVDAKDGTIRNRYSGIVNGTAVSASGTDLRGKTRNFTAWQEQDNLYQMIDVTRPIDDGAIVTVQNTGDISVKDLQKDTISGSVSSTSGWDPAAVSIITNIYAVLDYFNSTHNLNGYSSTQKNIQIRINGSVTSDGFPNNAFFNSQDYSISFGIGDDTQFLNLAGGLDVVAHEFTHGVISSTANLEYQNQSGALNESFADFFAAMVDRDDWVMGEDVYLPNRGVMRDMSDPHGSDGQQPATMSEYINFPNTANGDWGGVHTNSGIPNRAAWLVAEGLTAEGIGISIGKEKTEKIWYRALTVYLHPNDRFLEARLALIQAAIDLYGDATEAAAVRTAWDNVEIFEGMTGISSSITPSTIEPLPGTDWLVTVNNGGIYLQTPSGEFGPLNTVLSRNTRPSVVVGATDTFIFYVDDVSNDLRSINISTLTDSVFDDSNYYWSVAIPHNGGKLAYTLQTPEPYIFVVDLKQLTETPYYLGFQTDGDALVGNIQFADVMSFDFAGRKIVFDAKSIVTSNLGLPTYTNWTIGILDLQEGVITAPIPPQSNVVDIGNPVFATNNNFVIAFEYEDTDNNSIVTYNLTAKLQDALGMVAVRGTNDLSYFRQPFFNGDDTAVVFKYSPISGNSSIKSIPITKTGDTWNGDQAAISTYSANPGDYPHLFRNSPRTIDARLSVSSASLDFGTMLSGTSSKKTFTIRNTGNIDLTLKNMVLTGTGFTHNGTLGLLPRNSSMTIEVTYVASGLPGTKSASLTIYSDAESPNSNIVIPLTATVTITPPITKFIVTPAVGTGFTISPVVAQTVINNETTFFTVTPASGYNIVAITGCGGTLSGSIYTTGAVTANCTVSVTATNVGTSEPTISDALKVLRSVVGIVQLTSEEITHYDVSPLGSDGKPLGDGTLDIADALAIMRRSIGLGNWVR